MSHKGGNHFFLNYYKTWNRKKSLAAFTILYKQETWEKIFIISVTLKFLVQAFNVLLVERLLTSLVAMSILKFNQILLTILFLVVYLRPVTVLIFLVLTL